MPPTFIDLLSNGYFPKELPPNFATSSFSKFIETHETTLDTTFKNPKKISTINCKHSFSRSKSFRRELMIPNPILQYNLSKVLSDNWITINALINRSNISTSKPIKNELSKRAFIPEIEREKFSLKRAALRSSSKFILKTDISEFYHSIYTHSIPWAIHSKDTAKANRCNQLWGNLLDNWVRNGQDGQTIGIPVGPDSSLIIAEIIMSAIDLEIESKIKGIKGLRYFDDYEFSFSDRSSAESALNVINNIVNSYELRLNPIKTSILELPQRFEESWISKLRTYKFSSSIQGQKSDIADYFDVACDYYHQFQNSNVFTYAIARLRSETIAEENWDYVQHLLSQAMTVEPSLIPISYWIMLNHTEKGYSINKDIFTQCLNNLIIRLTPLGHSNELAWCLWGAMAFKIKIYTRAASFLEQVDDNVVAILAMDAETKGIFTRKISKDKWSTNVNTKSLYNENWLLTYESNVQGWILPAELDDPVAEDNKFNLLKENDVSFYTPLEYPINKADLEEFSKPSSYTGEDEDSDDYGHFDDYDPDDDPF